MSVEPPDFRGDPPEIEIGGFYICHAEGFDPVTIWVGRVDLPDDLGPRASEPVVSLIVRAVADEGPIMKHGPFWESAGLDGVVALATPFAVEAVEFAPAYDDWRRAFADGTASAWSESPNAVYVRMIAELREAKR